jgi:hypothetical protein
MLTTLRSSLLVAAAMSAVLFVNTSQAFAQG